MAGRKFTRPLESVLRWLRWKEPVEEEENAPDWEHETDPIGTILGPDGLDPVWPDDDDSDRCARLREFVEGAFELAQLLRDGRLRPADVLSLQRRSSDGHRFWDFIDPHLSSSEEARLVGAIVMYECAEHILQVVRADGEWKVFNGLESLPIDALDELDYESAEASKVGAEEPDVGLDDSQVEDDLTDEDFELRQLRHTTKGHDGPAADRQDPL